MRDDFLTCSDSESLCISLHFVCHTRILQRITISKVFYSVLDVNLEKNDMYYNTFAHSNENRLIIDSGQ